METEINLPYITADASWTETLQMKVTRARFEAAHRGIGRALRNPFNAALKDAI